MRDGDIPDLCDVCGRALDPDKGEAFLTDDGGTYCNDHYPYRDGGDTEEGQ